MWTHIRKALTVVSLTLGSTAVALPDPYSKVMFAIALGLSNAAIFLKEDK